MSAEFLSASEFAERAGITRQAAHAAMRRGLWRGHRLTVRKASAPSGGGRSGVRYEVALSSLPETYQKLLSGPCEVSHRNDIVPFVSVAPDQGERLTDGQYEKWQAPRFAIIEPAVRFGLTKAERADAIRTIVAAGHRESTVRRWIKLYDQFGIGGLARKAPSNRRQRRVIASRKFQKAWQAAGYPVDLLPELESFVDRAIMGLWKPFQLQFDLPYAYDDSAGAKESARRKATYRKQVAALDRSVPTIEPVDVKRRMVGRVDAIAIPGRPRFLDQGAVVHELASAGALIEHQSANDDDLAARRKARADRITANLLREQNRGK